MEYSRFNIRINAPVEKVWDTLFSDTNYPKWTAPFCEGSHAVTDWQEGSKALFLDNKQRGMFAVIEKSTRNKFLSIKALGEVIDGKEVTDSEGAKACAGSHEDYTLTADGNITNLEVILSSQEIPKDFKNFMDSTWPKAMDLIKELAEA